jgi:hypothetical protein
MTKPKITREIEGMEMSDASPASRAAILLKSKSSGLENSNIFIIFQGIRQEKFMVTSDFVTNLLRLRNIGACPYESILDIPVKLLAEVWTPLYQKILAL